MIYILKRNKKIYNNKKNATICQEHSQFLTWLNSPKDKIAWAYACERACIMPTLAFKCQNALTLKQKYYNFYSFKLTLKKFDNIYLNKSDLWISFLDIQIYCDTNIV